MEPTATITEAYQPAQEAARTHGYELTEVLGRGGTGVVFRATHEGGVAALKFAWPWGIGVMKADPEVPVGGFRSYVRQPRSLEDGRGVAYVPSPDVHLVNRVTTAEHHRLNELKDEALVSGLRLLGGSPRAAYAMDLVVGEPLKLEASGPLLSLAQAVHRLHERGWPHGDLKPENIRVAEGATGGVVLIDPLPVGSELITPEWSHLNFLVATPLVDSADPRDRRMVLRHRDLVALALMVMQAFVGERPWGHAEVSVMLDRTVSMDAKRTELAKARERLTKLLPKLPSNLRHYVALALEPGLWPEEGPTFAAYLQARPFETRCDALSTMDVGELVEKALSTRGALKV